MMLKYNLFVALTLICAPFAANATVSPNSWILDNTARVGYATNNGSTIVEDSQRKLNTIAATPSILGVSDGATMTQSGFGIYSYAGSNIFFSFDEQNNPNYSQGYLSVRYTYQSPVNNLPFTDFLFSSQSLFSYVFTVDAPSMISYALDLSDFIDDPDVYSLDGTSLGVLLGQGGSVVLGAGQHILTGRLSGSATVSQPDAIDTVAISRLSFDISALPVPEPASWAVMLGGLGLMGAAMRRRQRVSVRLV